MSSTDTNQASELFELCKRVYGLTGWATETNNEGRELYLEKWYWTLEGKLQLFAVERYKLLEEQVACPLYTSDYILEKLPNKLGEKWLNLSPETSYKGLWIADYQDNKQVSSYIYFANTPLKALLKLTIALSEAGELK